MEKWSDYREVPVMRKLFVVPLGENNHGKSNIVRAMIQIAKGEPAPWKKAAHILATSTGARISSLVFPSSYQEQEKPKGNSVSRALSDLAKANGKSAWFTYDLIIYPSHDDRADLVKMFNGGQGYGYDMVAVSITLDESYPPAHQDCLKLPWNERWIVRNYRLRQFKGKGAEDKNLLLTSQARAHIDMLAAQLWSQIDRGRLSQGVGLKLRVRR
jgi:hypothetical protein